MPGVRDGAAVVADGPTAPSTSSPSTPARGRSTATLLRHRLAETLPEYMVPSALHWRETLPLTANGKIDRTALAALAGELAASAEYDAPQTPTEQRLAAAWAKVLGVPQDQIGRRDHFFDRGGTSLSAVKLAVALDRAVSPKDLLQTPVLADLAELLDGRQAATRPTPRRCPSDTRPEKETDMSPRRSPTWTAAPRRPDNPAYRRRRSGQLGRGAP